MSHDAVRNPCYRRRSAARTIGARRAAAPAGDRSADLLCNQLIAHVAPGESDDGEERAQLADRAADLALNLRARILPATVLERPRVHPFDAPPDLPPGELPSTATRRRTREPPPPCRGCRERRAACTTHRATVRGGKTRSRTIGDHTIASNHSRNLSFVDRRPPLPNFAEICARPPRRSHYDRPQRFDPPSPGASECERCHSARAAVGGCLRHR